MNAWTIRFAAWLLAVAVSVAAAVAGAGTWNAVDDAATRSAVDAATRSVGDAGTLGFVATQAGQPFEGRFKRFQTNIAFDPDDLAASRADVTIDMASAVTGDPQKDAALPLPEWFDVKTHPHAHFIVRSFRHVGGDRFEAAADLTIRNVTREVVLPFEFTADGDGARVTGDLDIDRSDFGVGQGPWTSDQWIGHRVTVTISLRAVPALR
jgi:polyisoprenoid-binding protein YceI